MEHCRMKLLREIIGEDNPDVRFENNTLKPIVVIIDNQQGKSNSIQESLENENFVLFSPRNLSEAAIGNMGIWPESLRDAYQASKLPSRLMCVDPTQEEKSQLLAKNIIDFYNETAVNYHLFNKPNADGNMIPAFEDVGELDVLLARVGFVVQKSDDGNTVTVNGDGFTLTVDGQSGEIVDTTQQGKLGTGDKTSWGGTPISITEKAFKSLYELGKKGIADFKQFWENLRGNSR